MSAIAVTPTILLWIDTILSKPRSYCGYWNGVTGVLGSSSYSSAFRPGVRGDSIGLDSSNWSTFTFSSSYSAASEAAAAAASAAAAYASYFALSSAIMAAYCSALDGPLGSLGASEAFGGAIGGGPPFLGPAGFYTSFFSSSLSLPNYSSSVFYLALFSAFSRTGLSKLCVYNDLRSSPFEPLTAFA